MDWKYLFTSFEGRINRGKWWAGVAVLFAIGVVAIVIDNLLGLTYSDEMPYGIVYTIFAISAGARAAFQIATKFSHAPVAYLLSAVAAVIYLLAAICFTVPSRASWRTAVAALCVEFAGVVIVGILSVTDSGLFPDASVWSKFGIGYGFIPLALPLVGMWWLMRPATRAAFESSEA